jgi:hypothetical protein
MLRSVYPFASNFNSRPFPSLLILEANYPPLVIDPVESSTYLLLEMELWLHKTNQASWVGIFNYN